MTIEESTKKVKWKDLVSLSTKEVLIENNLTLGWKNKLTFNMFYHLEHHLFPAVSTIKMPELARRIDAQLPEIEKNNFLRIGIGLLLFVTNLLSAQTNTVWVDKVVERIMLHQLMIVDTAGHTLDNSTLQLSHWDTCVNGLWRRPCFVNNIFQAGGDGVLVHSLINWDTSTNVRDAAFVDFIKEVADSDGNLLEKQVVFSISRKQLFEEERKTTTWRSRRLEQSTWKSTRLVQNGKELPLDSCHQQLRWTFSKNGRFYQAYGNGALHCRTAAMQPQQKIGGSGDPADFYAYKDRIQGHYLTFQEGRWHLQGQDLRVVDTASRVVFVFELLQWTRQQLRLRLQGTDYILELRRTLGS
jgi:hypothetical protein